MNWYLKARPTFPYMKNIIHIGESLKNNSRTHPKEKGYKLRHSKMPPNSIENYYLIKIGGEIK